MARIAPRALHISKFSPNPRKERLQPINIHTFKYSETPIYKSYIHPCYDCSVTVYKYEFDKSMIVCANERS